MVGTARSPADRAAGRAGAGWLAERKVARRVVEGKGAEAEETEAVLAAAGWEARAVATCSTPSKRVHPESPRAQPLSIRW